MNLDDNLAPHKPTDSEINFVPGVEFGKDVLVPHVTRGGPVPNLDPIPAPDPKPVETEKPAESLGEAVIP